MVGMEMQSFDKMVSNNRPNFLLLIQFSVIFQYMHWLFVVMVFPVFAI